jgi:hypothetical protein
VHLAQDPTEQIQFEQFLAIMHDYYIALGATALRCGESLRPAP